MRDAPRHRLRHALEDPRWAVAALNTRMQWQRVLGWEPDEFQRIARNYLYSGVIDGWRFRQDLALLYLLARDIPGDGTTLEIGSFKGLATTALAYGVRAGRRAPVHTVDPHTGDRQHLEHTGAAELGSLEDFRRNLRYSGVANEVHAYTMTSDELATQWSGGPIRVLFIDGWHSYDAVTSDIKHWVPLLEPGGVVVIDDYANYDDVRAAVRDAADLLPPNQCRAGRMRLAHRDPLPHDVARYLRIPWG